MVPSLSALQWCAGFQNRHVRQVQPGDGCASLHQNEGHQPSAGLRWLLQHWDGYMHRVRTKRSAGEFHPVLAETPQGMRCLLSATVAAIIGTVDMHDMWPAGTQWELHEVFADSWESMRCLLHASQDEDDNLFGARLSVCSADHRVISMWVAIWHGLWV